jgi:predicted secreted Zn-dependent protease
VHILFIRGVFLALLACGATPGTLASRDLVPDIVQTTAPEPPADAAPATVDFADSSDLAAATTDASTAGVTIDQQTTTFEIVGSTAASLSRQLRAHASSAAGAGWLGETSWQFTWSYPHVEVAAGCRPGAADVTLRLQTQLPHWSAPLTSEAGLDQRWSTFIDALQTHEAGHDAIAVEAAHRLAQTLADIPAARTCDALDASARSIVADLVRTQDQAQAAYDVSTQHGLTQGAIFR